MKLLRILAFAVLATGLSCNSCNKPGQPDDSPQDPSQKSGISDVTPVTSSLSVELSTDKALYKPGETVRFKADNVPSGAKVRYRHQGTVVAESPLTAEEWTWTAPGGDFMGYLVDVYTMRSDGTEVIQGTIAVDVSSHWTHFPRYGFVGDFGQEKLTDGVIEAEMAFLNRCHINGIQFYDWHNKHHWPLGGTRGTLDRKYRDIANRDVYNAAVQKYISVQHSYGMAAMFYNLCYGILDGAREDGVKEEWFLYKGRNKNDQDSHELPAGWKSSIYLVDPSNDGWLDYLIQRNDDVYASLDFDGFHIDQLGSRGTRYDASGNEVNLPVAYAKFINRMKAAHPDKELVFNAVSSYGASMIAGTGNVGFLYNEVWDNEKQFKDLYTIIKSNDAYSNHTRRTVLAAYMNYNHKTTEFNNPGVLLADATIFALGGAHLELGDHMLCSEYFPSRAVKMNSSLKTAIVRYYDFMTAYENLLRGVSSQAEVSVPVTCTDASKAVKFAVWPPQEGKITTYAKKLDEKLVVNLINHSSADQLSWRDMDSTMPKPRTYNSVPVSLNVEGETKRIWCASPDRHGGASMDLAFEQSGSTLSFTVPFLEYWTMLVIEF